MKTGVSRPVPNGGFKKQRETGAINSGNSVLNFADNKKEAAAHHVITWLLNEVMKGDSTDDRDMRDRGQDERSGTNTGPDP